MICEEATRQSYPTRDVVDKHDVNLHSEARRKTWQRQGMASGRVKAVGTRRTRISHWVDQRPAEIWAAFIDSRMGLKIPNLKSQQHLIYRYEYIWIVGTVRCWN